MQGYNLSWQIPTYTDPKSENGDFFHLVPPTPDNRSSQPCFNGVYPQPSQGGYHLGPDQSSSKTRSPSIDSTDSQFDHGRWSVESDSSSEYDHTNVRGQLSIDPKLFQAKTVHPASNGDGDVGEIGEDFGRKGKSVKSPRGKKEKKKISHARKQGPEHIPRPRNAFILFRKHVVDSKLIPPSVEMRHQNVSVIVAKMWSEATPEQKARFNELARIEKEEHLKKYPGYRYQPVYRRTNVIRRRVRKDDAEEEKCRSVAELLIKGKSGEALEHEIKQKISKEKKSTSANELSKGALRALKSQARQSTSSDWSDLSAVNSRAGSLEVDGRNAGLDLAQQLQNEGYVMDNDGYLEGYDWDLGNIKVQQTYAYPQLPMEQISYYQPLPDLPIAPEFYTFDQALPFSPTASSFLASQPLALDTSVDNTGSNGSNGSNGSILDTNLDQVLGMPYPSPTSGLYGAPIRIGPVPPSARWDRLPSSEIPLEGLGFTFENDELLADFGAALAQADEW